MLFSLIINKRSIISFILTEVTEIGKLAWLTKSRILLLTVSVVAVSSLAWYFVEIHQRKPTPTKTTTITGEYLAVGNPCTTKPCLPGIVYAVLADNTRYYLTVEGSFLWSPDYNNRSWE